MCGQSIFSLNMEHGRFLLSVNLVVLVVVYFYLKAIMFVGQEAHFQLFSF